MIRALLVLLALSAQGPLMASDVPVETGVSLELAQHRAAAVSSVNYRLYFDVPADMEAPITASSRVSFRLMTNKHPLQLDFREDSGLLVSVSANDQPIEIDHRNEHLVIPATVLKLGENRLDIVFIAGSSSLNRNPEYLHTLFVPDRARTAFPLFDQPDLKATFDLTLDLPPEWRALANAPLATSELVHGKRRHVFKTSDTISSYLFAFVAGEFEQVTRKVGGRTMSMLHRETDIDKVKRNMDAIFNQHASGLEWMERYTGIDYPFQKFDFALIPGFPYGGMEHVGAIFYRANKLFLEEAPTERQLLDRATLIAHETAHMWFGNLVTMAWFNDVWTKEVYANFMAAKMVNPQFPELDHQLSFLVDHYPYAYEIDRTAGANPIRQVLPNLAEAGQMYGSIIYHKAPIMMRQLELVLGEADFQQGMREYLRRYAGGNVTWPELIEILDAKTETDLKVWSEVWVNTPGRPTFRVALDENGLMRVVQSDPAGDSRVWTQEFSVKVGLKKNAPSVTLRSDAAAIPWPGAEPASKELLQLNADGMGYGLFPASLDSMAAWDSFDDLQKGSLLVNLNENLLAQNGVQPFDYLSALLSVLAVEKNALVLGLALDQAAYLYQTLLTAVQQSVLQPQLESLLWQRLIDEKESGLARQFFEVFTALATSPEWLQRIREIWSGGATLSQVALSETDYVRLAQILAIRLPTQAEKIIALQLTRIQNPDNRRRLEFLAPSLSPEQAERDAFFTSLAQKQNRGTESWVIDGLRNLHHPSRIDSAVKYLRPALDLLQEIQRTGDIFFPMAWLQASFQNHNSAQAAAVADEFLATKSQYSAQLRMKILQASDRPVRAYDILSSGPAGP